MNTNEKIKKLPKWAQEEFKRQERIIKIYEKTLNLYRNKQSKSRIYIYEGIMDKNKIYLPENQQINFEINGKRIYAAIKTVGLTNPKEYLYINTTRSMLIKPEVSNAVSIFMED